MIDQMSRYISDNPISEIYFKKKMIDRNMMDLIMKIIDCNTPQRMAHSDND